MSEAANNHQSKRELYREEIANLRETVRGLEDIIHIKLAEEGEINSLRAKVKELESLISSLKDPNVAWTNMLRGHIGFPQHLKAAEDRIHELEADYESVCQSNKTYEREVPQLRHRIKELEEMNQALHPDNAPTDCWPVVLYMSTEMDRDELIKLCGLENPALKAQAAVYRGPIKGEK